MNWMPHIRKGSLNPLMFWLISKTKLRDSNFLKKLQRHRTTKEIWDNRISDNSIVLMLNFLGMTDVIFAYTKRLSLFLGGMYWCALG